MAGLIERAGKFFGWQQDRREKTPNDYPRKPEPEYLGSGTAAKAGKAVKGRGASLDEAIRKAGG